MSTDLAVEGVTWDLSDLYPSPKAAALEADLDEALRRAEAFALRHRGTINVPGGPQPAWMLAALTELESIEELAAKPMVYAELLHAADSRPAAHGALVARAQERRSAIQNRLVFFALEWLALDDEAARRLLDAPECGRYRHYLVRARSYRPHMLSEPEEQLLEETANTGPRAFVRLFDELLASLEFEVVVDGQRRRLNESGVLALLHDARRDVRRAAAAALTEKLRQQRLVLTFVFNVMAQHHALTDRLRRFPHPMAARNLENEIDEPTVTALLGACEAHRSMVADYYHLKRRILGLETLYDYDRYAPIEDRHLRWSWPEARRLVLTAYERFSPRMREVAELFFSRRWIDADTREGKRGGAFSSGAVPSVHPYVLLNYLGTYRDVSTLAHELGHGVHQYLSRERGYLQHDTPLTLAETASVFGELLVFEELRRQVLDPRARLAFLCQFIEDSFATVFRQVVLTRFEQGLHGERRLRGELSSEEIGAIWQRVNDDMYGGAVILTDDYRWWWSYIPHFVHSPFYCYAYSFGHLLVLALFQLYRERGAAFVPDYLALLAAGGSEAPTELLRRVGLDLRQASFWELGLRTLSGMVEEAKELAAEGLA